jgi:hypothetical protein
MGKTNTKITKIKKEAKEWESLAKELRLLIPRLNEEGLVFLIEQAQVHLYNMQVDELNSAIIKSEERKAAKSSGKAAAKNSWRGEDRTGGFSEIKASDSGSSYYIVYKTEWIMFSKDEIIKLVKIACGEGSGLDIKERLFNWFARERIDLLRSAGIADKFDNKLLALAKLLKKYRVKS